MEHGHVRFRILQATSDSSRCWRQVKANGCERMRHAERIRHGQSECNEHEGNSRLRHFYFFHLLVSFKNICRTNTAVTFCLPNSTFRSKQSPPYRPTIQSDEG